MPELRLENSVVDDRYVVERCLGRGSYAEIFLAYDQASGGRPVIIKSLNTSLQGTPDPDLEQTLVENFQNEALALDRVRHPHIIQRLGHGTAADLEAVPFHYLVLEYMPGGDLWKLCRNSGVCLDDALFYFQQVAEALAYAHSRQVIHRDIKPNNLLLSADRRVVKIADFGVAKMAPGEANEITRVGTNVYAPPEHHPDARADDGEEKLTPSADVYSLAKTIYSAITGRAPRQFSREPIGEIPGELASQPWAPALLTVLAKATASRVADRYQTVEAFWEDLTRVKLAGSSAEADDEATIVRSRLRAESAVEQLAARPNFHTLLGAPREPAHPQKARIVVELPAKLSGESRVEGPERGADEQRILTTRAFGSPEAQRQQANEARVRTGVSDQGVIVASGDELAAPVSRRTQVIRSGDGRGLWDRMRGVVTSEWLRRIFILFLAAALIGLAASTYYHFADQRAGLPLFASPAKDGRIAGASSVNLRSDPFGSVLAALPAGTRVRVIEERGGWMRVRVLDWAGTPPDNPPDSGWVNGRFVRLE